MTFRFSLTAVATVALSLACAGMAMAEAAVQISAPMIRISTPGAKTAAGFLTIANAADQSDRLLSAKTDLAERAELHTNKVDVNGMMRMLPMPDGIVIDPQAEHALESGGDHIMFLGLKAPLNSGDAVDVTLTFEHAGAITVSMPVVLTADLARMQKGMPDAMAPGHMDHSAMPGMTGN
ncbi:copper chaperone PCu(A)C [Phaeovulum sp. W22_SRMD_FR3]|uniref:copper chaperone PCu(A)C n=1 Tax=Phaeovulum sp. W22_SRMD_FR3 TaxID=3240274 RepID=UPI003F955068